MFKKIIFSLVLLCLLALPCAAWQQSFESHINDEPLELFTNGKLFTLNNFPVGYNNNQSYLAYLDENDPQYRTYLNVNKPFTDYLAMSVKVDQGYVPIFKVYNSTDDIIFQSSFQSIATNSADQLKWNRFEFKEKNDGVECFINGVSAGYHPYTGVKTSGGHFSAGIMQYNNTNSEYGMNMLCDDITDEEAIISCDSIVNTTDTGQYYKVGFPLSTGSYWFSKVTDPSGATVFQQYESDFGVLPYSTRLIPIVNLSTLGAYRISLYRHLNSSGADLFYSASSFEVSEPSENGEPGDIGYYLYVAPSTINPGEQLHITSHIPLYTAGYKLKLTYTTSSNVISSEYIEITEQDHTSLWTVPQAAAGGVNYVYLLNPSGDIVASYQYAVTGSQLNPTLSFSKSRYLPTDPIYLKYSNLPAGSELYIFELVGDTYSQPETSYPSQNGALQYHLKNSDAKQLYAVVNKHGNIVSTSADVANGFYILSGQIFDATTKSPISNAIVTLDNNSNTDQYTDSDGNYNFTASVGSHTIFVYKQSYASIWNNVILDSDINTQNFYLTPEYVAVPGNGSIYGISTNSATGATLGDTYIQIKNGTKTYSILSRADTGYFVFDSSDLTGIWTLTASKSGYDVYSAQITVNGNTYHQVKLHPVSSGGSGSGGSGSGSGSGSSGINSITGVPSERPGREAARQTMSQFETVVPGLFGLLILRIVMELMKT